MHTDNPRWWRRVVVRLSSLLPRRKPVAAEADDRALVMSLSPKRIPNWKQLRYLPRLLNLREQRAVRMLIGIAVMSALTLISTVLMRHVIVVPANGGTLTEAIVGAPQYLNPVLARPYSADTELTRLVFRGLLRIDEHMDIVPDLAETLVVSADGKTYTATLRQGLLWSDGSPVTAEDVVYTYETIADVAYQSPNQATYKSITIRSTEDQTIEFTLPAPNEPFRALLTLGILPSRYWQDQSPQTFSLAELNLKPIGNGPYKFQSVTKDRTGTIKSFTFVRNPNFTGTAPHIEKIITKVYPEMVSALDALTSGAVDTLGGITAEDKAKVQKAHSVRAFGLSQLTAVYFSQKSNPALKAKEVRQALALAIDRQSLITNTLNGVGRPANNPLLPGQPGYAADIQQFGFDQARANTMLEDAGWKKNDAGIRVKGTNQLAFSVTTVDEPSYIAIANALVQSWKNIGATVEVKTVGTDRLQKDVIRPRAYDAFIFGQIANADADPYPFWHSSQQRETGFALSIFFNKKLDQDLEAAQSATTADAHTAALRDFQAIVADEVPAIILAQSEYLYAHPASLRGFPSDRVIAPADRFDGIASWYVKTRWSWK